MAGHIASTAGKQVMCVCICTHTHTETHRHTHRYTHRDTHRHTQTHTDTHTQTHTQTHIHTHMHAPALVHSLLSFFDFKMFIYLFIVRVEHVGTTMYMQGVGVRYLLPSSVL